MSCTQMPRTSSRLEMINMEMSTQNIDSSDDEIEPLSSSSSSLSLLRQIIIQT